MRNPLESFKGVTCSNQQALVTPLLFSVQEFWRTCDETKAWINEKDVAFSSEDCGKDLASVQLLQRKQQVEFTADCIK